MWTFFFLKGVPAVVVWSWSTYTTVIAARRLMIYSRIQQTGVDPSSFECFTDNPWYGATCLNPGTLGTAYYHYKQQYGVRAMCIEEDMARYNSQFTYI